MIDIIVLVASGVLTLAQAGGDVAKPDQSVLDAMQGSRKCIGNAVVDEIGDHLKKTPNDIPSMDEIGDEAITRCVKEREAVEDAILTQMRNMEQFSASDIEASRASGLNRIEQLDRTWARQFGRDFWQEALDRHATQVTQTSPNK